MVLMVGGEEGLHRHNAGNAYRRCPSCGSCVEFALTPSPSAMATRITLRGGLWILIQGVSWHTPDLVARGNHLTHRLRSGVFFNVSLVAPARSKRNRSDG